MRGRSLTQSRDSCEPLPVLSGLSGDQKFAPSHVDIVRDLWPWLEGHESVLFFTFFSLFAWLCFAEKGRERNTGFSRGVSVQRIFMRILNFPGHFSFERDFLKEWRRIESIPLVSAVWIVHYVSILREQNNAYLKEIRQRASSVEPFPLQNCLC